MTEEIDLDELDVASDDEDEDAPNRGDWFWRDEGDPVEEPDAETADAGTETVEDAGTEAATEPDGTDDGDDSSGRVPHVPREDKNKPVGIPTESGGAGGEAATAGAAPGSDTEAPEQASGPHGGGIDDMTLAFTYDAIKSLEQPQFAVRDARAWSDWVGIVGDVDAHVINKFQRDNNIDADFFSGSGQSAAGRLADIDERSMFYAERMVVVGHPDEEALADQVGWEFVPLSEAAANADWELAADE